MTTHLTDTQLHDITDDAVVATDRAVLAAHLETCAECAHRLRSLRTLRAQLDALPRTIQPQADLLPALHARMRTQQRAHVTRTYRWPVLAAAAVLLCVLSSVVTVLVLRSQQHAPSYASVPARSTGPVQLVDLPATEARYVDAIDELRAALRVPGALEPETVRLLEQSLATIDRALADARTALAADPGNPLLAEMLQQNYERKLDLLRRASTHARTSL
jgi:anti-sigma factor RsiW